MTKEVRTKLETRAVRALELIETGMAVSDVAAKLVKEFGGKKSSMEQWIYSNRLNRDSGGLIKTKGKNRKGKTAKPKDAPYEIPGIDAPDFRPPSMPHTCPRCGLDLIETGISISRQEGKL